MTRPRPPADLAAPPPARRGPGASPPAPPRRSPAGARGMEPGGGRGPGGPGGAGGRGALERRVRELGAARAQLIESLAAREAARAEAARERDEARRDCEALAEQNALLVQVVGELKGLLAESRGQARRYRSERGSLRRQLEEAAAAAAVAAPGAAAGTAQGPQGFRIPRWSSESRGAAGAAGPAGPARRASGASASPPPGGRWSMDATQTPPAPGAPGDGAVPPAARTGGGGRTAGGSGGGGGLQGAGARARRFPTDSNEEAAAGGRARGGAARRGSGRGGAGRGGGGCTHPRPWAGRERGEERHCARGGGEGQGGSGSAARARLPSLRRILGRGRPATTRGGWMLPRARGEPEAAATAAATGAGGPRASRLPTPCPLAAPEDAPRVLGHQPHARTGGAPRPRRRRRAWKVGFSAPGGGALSAGSRAAIA